MENKIFKKNIIAKINVTSGGRILIKSDFIKPNEDYIIKLTEEKITISVPSIDYRGKTYKATYKGSGWIVFQVKSNLPMGKIQHDEYESNEDKLVIYYPLNYKKFY